jgi:hypothetical protein
MKKIFMQKFQTYLRFAIKLFLVFYFLIIFLEIYFPNLSENYFDPNIFLLIIAVLLLAEFYCNQKLRSS